MARIFYETYINGKYNKSLIVFNGKLLVWAAFANTNTKKNNVWSLVKKLFVQGLPINYSSLSTKEKTYVLRILFLIISAKEFNCDQPFSYFLSGKNNVYGSTSEYGTDVYLTTLHITKQCKQQSLIKQMSKNGIIGHNNTFLTTYIKSFSPFTLSLDDPPIEHDNVLSKERVLMDARDNIIHNFYRLDGIKEYIYEGIKYDIVEVGNYKMGLLKTKSQSLINEIEINNTTAYVKNGLAVFIDEVIEREVLVF